MIRIGCADLARTTGRTYGDEKGGIHFCKLLHFGRNVVLIINRLNRTDWLAGTAIDTFVRLDIEHPSAFVDTVDRTLLDTRFVLDIDTRFGNYVGHVVPFMHSNSLEPKVSNNLTISE